MGDKRERCGNLDEESLEAIGSDHNSVMELLNEIVDYLFTNDN